MHLLADGVKKKVIVGRQSLAEPRKLICMNLLYHNNLTWNDVSGFQVGHERNKSLVLSQGEWLVIKDYHPQYQAVNGNGLIRKESIM